MAQRRSQRDGSKISSGAQTGRFSGLLGTLQLRRRSALRRHVQARWARQRAWPMISTKWLAFMAAGATALATPAIAAAALPIRLTPSQIRLARTQAHFTNEQLAQMQRNVAGLNRRLTDRAPNPPAATSLAQGRSRSSRRKTTAPPLTYSVTCSTAPTAAFDPAPPTFPNWNLAITAHYGLLTACFGGLANRGEPNLGGAGVLIYETDTMRPPDGSQSSSATKVGVDYANATGAAQGAEGRWQNSTQVTLALPPADMWTSAANGDLCTGLYTSTMTCYTNNEYGLTLP